MGTFYLWLHHEFLLNPLQLLTDEFQIVADAYWLN